MRLGLGDWLAPLILAAAFTCTARAAEDPLAELGPVGKIKQVATGFGFVEGPADDGHGNLYFTDIPNSRIHRLAADGSISIFDDDSHHANGLMFTPGGQLLAAEMDGAVVERVVATGARRIVTDSFEGQRFNAPNDLVLDSHGGVYFTDPHFRAPQPLPQGTQGAYYVAADGSVTRVAADLPAPNGILLSLDEKTLYVAPTQADAVLAYPVESPGVVGAAREFCKLRTRDGRRAAGCDGCTLDERGNLYVTTELGIQVVSPQGEWLGVIELPEQPANCTFGGSDGKTLYATARTSVYAVPMRVKGHRYGGEAKTD